MCPEEEKKADGRSKNSGQKLIRADLLAEKEHDNRRSLEADLDPFSLGDGAVAVSVELLKKTLDEVLERRLLATHSSTDTSHLVDDALDFRTVDGARTISIEGLEEEVELLLVIRGLDELDRLLELSELDGAVLIKIDEAEEVVHLLGSSTLHAGLKELLELLLVERTAMIRIESVELGLQALELLLAVLLATSIAARSLLRTRATHIDYNTTNKENENEKKTQKTMEIKTKV